MITIGRKDKIDLPELGLFDLEAKIDTGAYGCALHCHHIETIVKDGKKLLSFKVLDPSHPEYEDRVFQFENFSGKVVKNSIGTSQYRYTIKTKVIIFDKKRIVEFSLTNREDLKHPVLLGRKFLSKRFIVDVNLKNISFQQKLELK